jgi:hypothetical protein
MLPRGLRRLAAGLLLLAAPATAPEAPRALFPPASPAPTVPPPAPAPPIQVEDLAPPTLAARGLSTAEEELGGPLWAAGAPTDLAPLLARLPTAVPEPALLTLQRDLLAAPGPPVAGDALFVQRLDLLLAMGEPGTVLDLLAPLPEGPPAIELRRLQALFAADRTDPACAAAAARRVADPPWPEARLVCAALARDGVAVELGLDLLAADAPPDPLLAGLARAAVDGRRVALGAGVAADPLLLPLLRRVAIDADPAKVAALPTPVRRVLADNPSVSAAVRAAAAPPRPGPSARPELNGNAPADWAAALADVPADRRARWLALADGLGLEVPDGIWTELARAGPAGGTDPAPDLYVWRAFEVARVRQQRGAMLLCALLLLDGRPEAAAPVTLRRALDALVELGLEPAARAVAAGTGGALGL